MQDLSCDELITLPNAPFCRNNKSISKLKEFSCFQDAYRDNCALDNEDRMRMRETGCLIILDGNVCFTSDMAGVDVEEDEKPISVAKIGSIGSMVGCCRECV